MAGIHKHRGVDIIMSHAGGDRWLVSWKFPGEDDVIHVYRPSESQALSYAKKQIDQCLDPVPEPPAQIIWRKGEDWWSGEQIENGCVPSDATPYGLIGDEWQPLT